MSALLALDVPDSAILGAIATLCGAIAWIAKWVADKADEREKAAADRLDRAVTVIATNSELLRDVRERLERMGSEP